VTAILLSIAAGYLIGSVPFGYLAGRMKGVDVRQHGSRNIGATNVWRVCGAKLGLPVFLLDVGKGVAAVLLAWRIAGTQGGDAPWCGVAGALACVIGHGFPAWLGFKGGKGVATSLGAIITIMWKPSVIIFGVWAVVFALSRYVSLASIVAAAAFPLVAFVFDARGAVLGFAVAAATFVIVRHRANIQRLLAGTENRAGSRKEKPR
jgi:acyl phosphate:glycerol-3-phosphate acyltransferase